MAALERPRQFGQLQHLDFRIVPAQIRGLALERDSRDRVFFPGGAQKRARQLELPAAKLKNGLARQQMDRVSESLSPPEQPIANDWIVLLPVLVAISLADRQGRYKRRAISDKRWFE